MENKYASRAKEKWGGTKEYEEYERKSGSRTNQEEEAAAKGLMGIFTEFGALRRKPEKEDEVIAKVIKLKEYITDNYYNCTDEILAYLGKMYVSDDEFRQNIDDAGGEGTAEFVSRAIEEYRRRNAG